MSRVRPVLVLFSTSTARVEWAVQGDARRSTRSTINRASYVSRDEEGDSEGS